MSCSIKEKIIDICRNDYEYFLKLANVVGLAYSYKITKGIKTCEECIQIYVIKKYPLNKLDSTERIPSLYMGIKTDIIESGPFKAQALTERVRPVIGGYSVGPLVSNITGTMGCLVSDGISAFMLSNNHILADENRLPVNSVILQPSIRDGGRFPQDAVALLTKFIPLNFVTPSVFPINHVDAAIAEYYNFNDATNEIAFIGAPTGIIHPVIDLVVQKTGKESEYTIGQITALNGTIVLTFPSGRSVILVDQILTSLMSSSGDSGSLLLDFDNEAVGMLNGASNISSSYSPIETVLNALNVSLVTN